MTGEIRVGFAKGHHGRRYVVVETQRRQRDKQIWHFHFL